MPRPKLSFAVALLVLGSFIACKSAESEWGSGKGGSGAAAGDGSGGSGAAAGDGSGASGGTGGSGDTGGSGGDGGAGTGGEGASGGSAGTGADGGTGGDGGGGGNTCPSLPDPTGPIISVTPDRASELPDLVRNAEPGSTLVLDDGLYDLSSASLLHFTNASVTLRSASGDREAVILDGGYVLGEIALIAADDVTIADITLRRALWHPIHVTGGSSANITGTRIHNVHVIDPGQQAIKINASTEGYYADEGTIACSLVELTDAGRGHVTDCYTGGIDAHSAWGWVVRDNSIEGFWCEEGLSEHAVHFWVTGRDTLVERNRIVDCARGIGFGLGETGNGQTRVYPDAPCPSADYAGHIDGIIRNNFIVAARPELFASASGFDAGISLEQACGAEVVHNSVAALEAPFASIEYRWPNTDATLKNNLVTHTIMERDQASAELDGNITDAALSAFVSVASSDLHLVPTSPAVDKGVALPAGLADEDIDGEARMEVPDVGADEVGR